MATLIAAAVSASACQVPDDVRSTIGGPAGETAAVGDAQDSDVVRVRAELVRADGSGPDAPLVLERFVTNWLQSCRSFVLRNPTPAFDRATVSSATARRHAAMRLGSTPETIEELIDSPGAWQQVACYGVVFTEAQEREHQAQVYLGHALTNLDQNMAAEPRYRGGCVDATTGHLHISMSRRNDDLERTMLEGAGLDHMRQRVLFAVGEDADTCTPVDSIAAS